MKIAPIPPTALLEQYSTDYHLCLAHVLGHDSRQVDYYRARADLGEYVILDNGAYELGRSVPFEHVLEVASWINPKEIVLPDVFLDCYATVRATEYAYEDLRHKTEWDHTNLMVVPQGKSLDEWMTCLRLLVTLVKPDAIGIPIVYETMMGRGVLLHRTIQFLHNRTDCQPDIHLLGWDGDLYKLNAYAKQFPFWVRGIDSAKPFYYAGIPDPQSIMSGVKISRPKGYFDFTLQDLDHLVLGRNLDYMDSAANGDLAKFFM